MASPQDPDDQPRSLEAAGLPPDKLLSKGVLAYDDHSSAMFGGLPRESLSDVQEAGGEPDSQAQATFMVGGGGAMYSKEEANFPSLVTSQLVDLDLNRDLKGELAENKLAILDLKAELETTTTLKEKATQELLESTELRKATIAEKDFEIEQLKSEVEDYKSRLSKVEKENSQEKRSFEMKIRSLEESLRNKEAERRKENEMLNQRIIEQESKILKMETKEESLRHKLTEAWSQVSIAKAREETAVAKLAISEEQKKRLEEEIRRSLTEMAALPDEELRVSLTDLSENFPSLGSTDSGSMSDLFSSQPHSM